MFWKSESCPETGCRLQDFPTAGFQTPILFRLTAVTELIDLNVSRQPFSPLQYFPRACLISLLWHLCALDPGPVIPATKELTEWAMNRALEIKAQSVADGALATLDAKVPRSWERAMNHMFCTGHSPANRAMQIQENRRLGWKCLGVVIVCLGVLGW